MKNRHAGSRADMAIFTAFGAALAD